MSTLSPPASANPRPQRPTSSTIQPSQPSGTVPATSLPPGETSSHTVPKKKRNHRGGKKKRARRRSFAASIDDDGTGMPEILQAQNENAQSAARSSFYRIQGLDLSNTSLESESLLDHRDQQSMKARRSSTITSAFGQPAHASPNYRAQYQSPFKSTESISPGSRSVKKDIDIEDESMDERAPLLSPLARSKTTGAVLGYGAYNAEPPKLSRNERSNNRRKSSTSSSHSKRRTIFDKQHLQFPHLNEDYNVNYPPSMPGSPRFDPAHREMSFGDMMVRDDFESPSGSPRRTRDDISEHAIDDSSRPESPRLYEGRRHTIALQAEEDVCFPIEEMSELADEDMTQREETASRRGMGIRRRRGKWPDLAMLDDWSRFEKEGRNEERRAKRITEPQLIGGRLRPIHKGWHRAEDDAPYRFTYFNEEFKSTIHSQTISELVQPGSSFRELFVPDPPVLSDSESDNEEGDYTRSRDDSQLHHTNGINAGSTPITRQGSLVSDPRRTGTSNESDSRRSTDAAHPNSETKSPDAHKLPHPSPDVVNDKPKRYGERPTWWLDVLSPTDAEMKVLSKTFGIHPLTAEDIMVQEAREKVELFQNYYFVNYRSFEQDMNNEDFLEPVNMYVVVFRQGIISFHFSMTPHPANVRRRVRQLQDYLILSSDWISYAIIDDITDVFAPLIQSIEDEVDDIDDAILRLHSSAQYGQKNNKDNEKRSEAGDGTSGESGGDMLRRVGDCRKKVMSLYRLLGNKADVIKGFAKRCNEQWEVAPRSEIGLYLGDIQDHIITMTGNLSHYEKILARSHGNYLAQINIRMNERQEQTADVLGKLTVLGTIVLPMNIITGLWGMNVWVPGQDTEGDLTWFFWITAGLLCFGCACFFIARALYRIV